MVKDIRTVEELDEDIEENDEKRSEIKNEIEEINEEIQELKNKKKKMERKTREYSSAGLRGIRKTIEQIEEQTSNEVKKVGEIDSGILAYKLDDEATETEPRWCRVIFKEEDINAVENIEEI